MKRRRFLIDGRIMLRLLLAGVTMSGALLLATGADPVHLKIPGADLPHVCYLRTLADSRRIIENAKSAKRAVVIGSSFIGLEVAWSLRERKLEVAVVGRDSVPLAKVLGTEMGNLVRETHESHGVKFHLGRTPAAIHDQSQGPGMARPAC